MAFFSLSSIISSFFLHTENAHCCYCGCMLRRVVRLYMHMRVFVCICILTKKIFSNPFFSSCRHRHTKRRLNRTRNQWNRKIPSHGTRFASTPLAITHCAKKRTFSFRITPTEKYSISQLTLRQLRGKFFFFTLTTV